MADRVFDVSSSTSARLGGAKGGKNAKEDEEAASIRLATTIIGSVLLVVIVGLLIAVVVLLRRRQLRRRRNHELAELLAWKEALMDTERSASTKASSRRTKAEKSESKSGSRIKSEKKQKSFDSTRTKAPTVVTLPDLTSPKYLEIKNHPLAAVPDSKTPVAIKVDYKETAVEKKTIIAKAEPAKTSRSSLPVVKSFTLVSIDQAPIKSTTAVVTKAISSDDSTISDRVKKRSATPESNKLPRTSES